MVQREISRTACKKGKLPSFNSPEEGLHIGDSVYVLIEGTRGIHFVRAKLLKHNCPEKIGGTVKEFGATTAVHEFRVQFSKGDESYPLC